MEKPDESKNTIGIKNYMSNWGSLRTTKFATSNIGIRFRQEGNSQIPTVFSSDRFTLIINDSSPDQWNHTS